MEAVRKIRTYIKAVSVISLILLMVMVLAPLAVSDPVDQKRSEAGRVKSEIQQYEEEIGLVVERYNYFVYKLDETYAQIEDNKVRLTEAEEDLKKKQGRLNRRVRAIYMKGEKSTFLEVALKAESIDCLLTGLEFTKKVSQNDAKLVVGVKKVRGEIITTRQKLESQKEELAALKKQVTDEKAEVERCLAERERHLAGLESDISALLSARISRPSSRSGRRSSGGVPVVYRSPSSGRPAGPAHGGVVGVAYAQLGKPYVYAGAGPSVFDCSGLVQYCYGQQGISVPHSSYAQANIGTSVSVSELQPGDILGFRGWGHVGIYVGNGQYIHAPRTGDVVRVADLSKRRNFSGAVRP